MRAVVGAEVFWYAWCARGHAEGGASGRRGTRQEQDLNSTTIRRWMGMCGISAAACGAPNEAADAPGSRATPAPLGVSRQALSDNMPGAAPRADAEGTELEELSEEARRAPEGLAAQVEFAECSEVASLASVPFAGARALVPARFTLSGDTTNAVVVVRVAHCRAVRLEGARPRAATVAQVGVNLSGPGGQPGPDASADINNYTVFFATDDARLARELRQRGVEADYDARLDYALDDEAAPEHLRLAVRQPPQGRYRAASSLVAPTADPVRYVASWWVEGPHGTVQMRTVLPAIRFGGSELVLHPERGSALERLLGTRTPSFDLFDSFNTFYSATMRVTLSAR